MTGSIAHLLERGLAHQRRGETEAAESIYRHVLSIDPRNAVAAANLGMVRHRQGRLDEAAVLYARAVELAPELTVAENNLAVALQELGRAHEALAIWGRIAAHTDDPAIAANYLTCLNLVPGDPATSLREARHWAARFADRLSGPPPARSPDPERRLRIGYIGTNQLRRHTLAMTLLPLFGAHDPAQVEVFAYSDLAPEREDDVSQKLRSACAAWRRTADLSDDRLAALIREDAIDILVDAAGFSAGSRLLALARRPAPLQLQFPVMSTTGMTAMDYAVGDTQLLPDGMDAFFVERLWRLPYGYVYAPLIDLPPITPPPAARNGHITFGSFNRIAKIGPEATAIWARCLHAVPGSHLIIKSSGLSDGSIARYIDLFQQAGIARERIEFRGHAAADTDHFRQYNDIDIAFDPLPHCGVVTTLDALSMGVPVVSLAGARPLERYGAAILGAIAFDDGVARSAPDYVAKAAALASEPGRLMGLRAELPRRLRACPIGNPRAFAPLLEAAFRDMWRRWCAGSRPSA